MEMEITQSTTVTQWLSFDEIKTLLATGELSIASPKGILRLYVNFIDRVAAQELVKK